MALIKKHFESQPEDGFNKKHFESEPEDGFNKES